jgi:cysteinyl-tRNA synthetase
MIHVYNSMTKQKEPLTPLEGRAIRMYSCGVTVYDQCHVGHARSLYVFDVIRRYLKYRGYDVRFVRNITDIDDKIIDKARQTGKTSAQVTGENIAGYYRDMDRLGVHPADVEPKATENIPIMIEHIRGLIDKGYAYEADGDVYFHVRRCPDYGKLSGQSIAMMQEAVRIEKDEKKKDPLDFALWKRSKEDEPFWDSPWGKGRPGWHIECSCMSMKHLDAATLDIHAGGRDLIFPHHENEIAQSEALTGKPFARYWIHHGLLTIQGQKMAKSLGNFITIADVLKRHSADDLKYFFLSSHYSSPIDFSEDRLEEAHKAMERLGILLGKARDIRSRYPQAKDVDVDFVDEYKKEFEAAMDDDFNTPKAMAALFKIIKETNKFVERDDSLSSDAADVIHTAVAVLTSLGRDIFGFKLDKIFVENLTSVASMSVSIQDALLKRQEARLRKDFRKSDELRDFLKAEGVIVEDTKEGQKWRGV